MHTTLSYAHGLTPQALLLVALGLIILFKVTGHWLAFHVFKEEEDDSW